MRARTAHAAGVTTMIAENRARTRVVEVVQTDCVSSLYSRTKSRTKKLLRALLSCGGRSFLSQCGPNPRRQVRDGSFLSSGSRRLFDILARCGALFFSRHISFSSPPQKSRSFEWVAISSMRSPSWLSLISVGDACIADSIASLLSVFSFQSRCVFS